MNLPSHSRNPEVSVLMSCYNASRWLHEAIDSVLAQTFGNFEFILVDDGSTDESWNIIQGYRDRDARIVAISKKNTGLADSLNMGIAQARGVWIARLDADDLCEPIRIEEQIQFVQRHPEVVLLGTGFIEIDEQGRAIKTHRYPSRHSELVRHLERLKRFFPHSSALFRRKIVQDAGCYNPFFRKSQDLDLWFRIAERGRIACLGRCLVSVRKHTEQISNSTAGASQLVYGTAASACHFLRIHGHPDPSATGSEPTWQEFIARVDRCMINEGVFERRKVWAEARAEYFGTKNRLNRVLNFSNHLLRSGHAGLLAWERIFGSSLARRLARDWTLATA